MSVSQCFSFVHSLQRLGGLDMQIAGLQKYIFNKLQSFTGTAPDAAFCSLALWMLEATLPHSCKSVASVSSTYHAKTCQRFESLQTAALKVTGDDAETTATVDVADFVQMFQMLLPYSAVEQILLDSGSYGQLMKVAKLYGMWQTVFHLCILRMCLFF